MKYSSGITINEEYQPLVSCIMPTYNRREFVPHAIRYFLRQEYENKELIIIDDGTDTVENLIPDNQSIRYVRLDQKITLGAKLNLACKYAAGNIIANWDDDDWYAPRRLRYQVDSLKNKKTYICGINRLLYFDLRSKHAYQYIYPANQPTWLLGSSLCFRKELWSGNPFSEINVGMDGLFVWATSPDRISVLPDTTIAVHMIHDHNVSPKQTDSGWWHSYPVDEIRNIMEADWPYYNNGEYPSPVNHSYTPDQTKISVVNQPRQVRNIHACLVHENEDCIIDLVRNLHYHDPSSVILLYNGGNNPHLIQNNFPYKKFGAVIHPDPIQVKHGYLHNFALKCMEYTLENFSFDTLTIVDSDQLGIRSGYSGYLGQYLSSLSNVGMLSSRPERLSPDNKDVWPAIQAFKEYDLWKPLLRNFHNGENKFVHWTFWPSTVFTLDAVRDLIELFKHNKLLQEIMRHTRIWATEEIILPTLVRLLGHEIARNPCSYDFNKYQRTISSQEISIASRRTDVYWTHPIERRYENLTRKQIRQQFNHYSIPAKMESIVNNSTQTMFSPLASLKKIKEIEGWLSDAEADLLLATTLKACIELPSPHAIVEVGSYQGKSTVLLGSVIEGFFPLSKVYAIDPHEGVVGAVDQGLQSLLPTLEKFKLNIEKAGLSEVIEPIKNYSYNVTWETPISLLFIDGLHDYPNVARDFWHFSGWIIQGGYVAFHDYATYYPGVQGFVQELLKTEAYRQIHLADSLIIVQKL